MISYKTGNLLDSEAEALVNAVNNVGVMGKGIALLFKNKFPANYKIYKKACDDKELPIGILLITQENTTDGHKIIINFPTKTHWRKPSEYSYIEAGLPALAQAIRDHKIRSIAIPALGAGNGGLDWEKVKAMLEQYLGNLDCNIHVYSPQ